MKLYPDTQAVPPVQPIPPPTELGELRVSQVFDTGTYIATIQVAEPPRQQRIQRPRENQINEKTSR